MQNQQIKEVGTRKHLGLHSSKDGSWHHQIQYIKYKAWKLFNTMRKLKFKLLWHSLSLPYNYFDRKSLEIIYTAFIRPILEYGDIVWDNCAQYEKEEAACIVTGTTRLISIYSLYNEIKRDFLQKRRNDHRLSLFFKMKNNLKSPYLSSLVPQNFDRLQGTA